MRRILTAVVASAVMAAAPVVPGVFSQAPVHKATMADCEDSNVQPCLTFDEGQWRMVLSYRPYTARKATVCARTARTYPCLTRSGSTLTWNFRSNRFLP